MEETVEPILGQMSATVHAVSSVNNEVPGTNDQAVVLDEQAGFEADVDPGDGAGTYTPGTKETEEPKSDLEQFLVQKAGLLADMDAAIFSLTKKQKFNRADIMKTFARQNKLIKALDTLVDAIINDLQVSGSRYNVLETNMFKITQQLTVMTSVLKDKALVTDEEIVETWEKKIKPQMEQKVADLQKKMAETVPATTATAEEAPPVA